MHHPRSLWEGLDIQGADIGRVKRCRKCGATVVWIESPRTHKNYPVDVRTGNIDVLRNDFHQCKIR